MSEEVINLRGSNGGLLAILHRPEHRESPVACVIMLSSAQTPNFGPQRLYVKSARAWAQKGLHVLRVDLSGVGDAEAENPEVHVDCHSPQDVAIAVAYARNVLRSQIIVLHGHCSGARVAIKYAASDPIIDAVVCWNVPMHTVEPISFTIGASDSQARANVMRVIRAITEMQFLSPAWWRWVRPNAGAFSRQIAVSIARLVFNRHLSRNSQLGDNRPFIHALTRYLAQKREIILIYGSAEYVAIREFLEEFPAISRTLDGAQSIQILPDGNHTLSTLAVEQEAIRVSGDWILSRVQDKALNNSAETYRPVKTA